MNPIIICIIGISILILCLCAIILIFGVCWVKPKTYCNPSNRFTKEPIVAYYINLDHRTDRRERMIKEFHGSPLNLRRMPAVLSKVHGGIGCAKSHIKVLEEAMRLNLPHVLVLEDDVAFKERVDWSKVLSTLNCIDGNEDWDVIFLGGVIGKYVPRGPRYSKICSSHGAYAYLVNGKYLNRLIGILKASLNSLISNLDYKKNAFDQRWKVLQKKDNWLGVWPLPIKHNVGFSDIDQIEKKNEGS